MTGDPAHQKCPPRCRNEIGSATTANISEMAFWLSTSGRYYPSSGRDRPVRGGLVIDGHGLRMRRNFSRQQPQPQQRNPVQHLATHVENLPAIPARRTSRSSRSRFEERNLVCQLQSNWFDQIAQKSMRPVRRVDRGRVRDRVRRRGQGRRHAGHAPELSQGIHRTLLPISGKSFFSHRQSGAWEPRLASPRVQSSLRRTGRRCWKTRCSRLQRWRKRKVSGCPPTASMPRCGLSAAFRRKPPVPCNATCKPERHPNKTR